MSYHHPPPPQQQQQQQQLQQQPTTTPTTTPATNCKNNNNNNKPPPPTIHMYVDVCVRKCFITSCMMLFSFLFNSLSLTVNPVSPLRKSALFFDKSSLTSVILEVIAVLRYWAVGMVKFGIFHSRNSCKAVSIASPLPLQFGFRVVHFASWRARHTCIRHDTKLVVNVYDFHTLARNLCCICLYVRKIIDCDG